MTLRNFAGQIVLAMLLLFMLSSCATTSYKGRGTATIVKANGNIKQRNMKVVKCVKKRLRVEKRNHYARQRKY